MEWRDLGELIPRERDPQIGQLAYQPSLLFRMVYQAEKELRAAVDRGEQVGDTPHQGCAEREAPGALLAEPSEELPGLERPGGLWIESRQAIRAPEPFRPRAARGTRLLIDEHTAARQGFHPGQAPERRGGPEEITPHLIMRPEEPLVFRQESPHRHGFRLQRPVGQKSFRAVSPVGVVAVEVESDERSRLVGHGVEPPEPLDAFGNGEVLQAQIPCRHARAATVRAASLPGFMPARAFTAAIPMSLDGPLGETRDEALLRQQVADHQRHGRDH